VGVPGLGGPGQGGGAGPGRGLGAAEEAEGVGEAAAAQDLGGAAEAGQPVRARLGLELVEGRLEVAPGGLELTPQKATRPST
jgi:hypothetical protein